MADLPAKAEDVAAAGVDPHKADELASGSGHPVLLGFNKLPMARQIATIGGIALVIALSIAILLWSQEPSWKPLIHRLQDHNAQDIIEVLQREGIAFEIDPGSQILLVEAADLHEARMKLAAASLIDDKTVGLEVLDKDSSLGTSQFIENARYRRGLEGELARTIASVCAGSAQAKSLGLSGAVSGAGSVQRSGRSHYQSGGVQRQRDGSQ